MQYVYHDHLNLLEIWSYFCQKLHCYGNIVLQWFYCTSVVTFDKSVCVRAVRQNIYRSKLNYYKFNNNFKVYMYILVASEIDGGLAGAPPFLRWWTKSFVTKAFWLWPNSTIKHSYNDVAFNRSSTNFLRKPNEVPWSCCKKLFLFARDHRHYAIHSYIFIVMTFFVMNIKNELIPRIPSTRWW